MPEPLAGLQNGAPFLPGVDFEKFVPGAAPTYEDIVEGRDLVKYDKVPVRIVDYQVKVFDMLSEGGRSGYSGLMKMLTEGVQTAKYVVYRNDLQVLQRGGDSQWFRYVEYAEYDLNDPLLRRKVSQGQDSNGSSAGVVSPGVIQEIG